MKEKIERLKKEKNAVILTHYYAPAEAQEVADYVGDSFYLAKIAKSVWQISLYFAVYPLWARAQRYSTPIKRF